METTSQLLDMALKVVGPVQFGGRLYKSSMSIVSSPEEAPGDTPEANGLFVQIVSPINGMARRVE